ncbi:MAG: two pore domain potassium channel family protein [Chthoniobacterales bacterium]|nr:two pore domain potassium channel family protein [Chthoniobacterales bacterium]
MTKQGFWSALSRHPFGVLLVALFLMLVLAPSSSLFKQWNPNFYGMVTLAPLSLFVIGASMLTLWKRAHHHARHMFAGGVVLIVLVLGSVLTHHTWIPIQLIIQILFLSYVLGIVVRAVFQAKIITSDILCGAVSVYLLVGVLAGLGFVLIEYYVPGSFLINNMATDALAQRASFLEDPGSLLYFSFVTLTTVGYGDILPASAVARSAAILVAVLGQVLLMVQIARLVGMHVAQGSESRE